MLEELLKELREYEDKYRSEYWNFFENKDNENLEFNIVGKKKFLEFIQGFIKIKPIKDYKNIKKLKYKGDVLNSIDIEYIQSLIIIKKLILKEECFDVINNFLNLEKRYNILQEKLYYSITNII